MEITCLWPQAQKAVARLVHHLAQWLAWLLPKQRQKLKQHKHSQKEIEHKVEQARIQANLDALKDEGKGCSTSSGKYSCGRYEFHSTPSCQRPACCYLCDGALQPPCPQRTTIIPSTPHPLIASQTQVAVSVDITPHQAHQASRTSGPAQQSFSQPLNSFPAPQPSGNHPQQNLKEEPFSPVHTPAHRVPYEASHDHSTSTGDLIRYLTRDRLVTSGLTTYDDQPMNYCSWKSSFQNAITNLDLSTSEELDLLTKVSGKRVSRTS